MTPEIAAEGRGSALRGALSEAALYALAVVVAVHAWNWLSGWGLGDRHGTYGEVVGLGLSLGIVVGVVRLAQLLTGSTALRWRDDAPRWIVIVLPFAEGSTVGLLMSSFDLPGYARDIALAVSAAALSLVSSLADRYRNKPAEPEQAGRPEQRDTFTRYAYKALWFLGWSTAVVVACAVVSRTVAVPFNAMAMRSTYTTGAAIGVALTVAGFVLTARHQDRRAALRSWRVRCDVTVWAMGFGTIAASLHASSHRILPWYVAGLVGVGAVVAMTISDAITGPYDRYGAQNRPDLPQVIEHVAA